MHDIGRDFQSGNLRPEFIKAPDGSEIRLLHELHMGGMSECTLPPNRVSVAIKHKTVEEIWLCTAGKGEIWRSQNGVEEILPLSPGVSLTIPLNTCFQFRNPYSEPLKIVIATMPPWPGDSEISEVQGPWKTDKPFGKASAETAN